MHGQAERTFEGKEDEEGKIILLLCRVANVVKKAEMVIGTYGRIVKGSSPLIQLDDVRSE